MSEITKQINKLLSDDALSHSLSKEALERMLNEIKSLDNDCYKFNKKNEELRADLKDSNEKLQSCREANVVLTTENKLWTAREKDLLIREKTCTRTEIENEYAKQRGDEHYGLITSIFANRTFRESVTSSFPVKEKITYDNNNMMRESECHVDVTKTETKETEEK